MSFLLLNIDTERAFTVFEACPDPRCHAPRTDPPFLCPRCEGRRGRQQTFGTVEEVREYLRALPRTPALSWAPPAARVAASPPPPARPPSVRPHQIAVDSDSPYVMFEACPQGRCHDLEGAQATCAKCEGTRGHKKAFDTSDAMTQYVSTAPGPWSSWPPPPL